MKYCLAVLILLASLAGPSSACTFPTEFPYDPTQHPSDLVIEGIATSAGRSDGDPFADVRISEVYVGTYSASSYRLKWWNYDGSGMCEPPGPAVEVGQRVRIYLQRANGQFGPLGWVLAKEIPKSKDQVQRDQAIAQERAARQDKHFPVGGALSFTDPKEWLKIEDIPELRGSPGMVLVSFSVSPAGTMENCSPGHVAKYVSLDRKACKVIEKRARLVPPKFPEEARGSFEMYPPEVTGSPPDQPEPNAPTSDRYLPRLAILLTLVAAIVGSLVWWIRRSKSRP